MFYAEQKCFAASILTCFYWNDGGETALETESSALHAGTPSVSYSGASTIPC